jgi:hypothetical protein
VDCFEKKILDNSAHFFDTDKRPHSGVSEKGRAELEEGMEGGRVTYSWDGRKRKRGGREASPFIRQMSFYCQEPTIMKYPEKQVLSAVRESD